MKLYSVCPFVSGLFNWECFVGSTITWKSSSSFYVAEKCPIVLKYNILFIRSSVDGLLNYCHFFSWLQVMLLCTFLYIFLWRHVFSLLWGIYLAVEFLGHFIILCFIWGFSKINSTVAVPFYILFSNILKRFQFLCILTTIIIVHVLMITISVDKQCISLWFSLAFP